MADKEGEFAHYQHEAMVTHRPDRTYEFLVGNYALGLAGEAGEVADLLKKHLYHDRELDTTALIKELGDVLWYVAALCEVFGLKLGDVADINILKLRARHNGGGFDPRYHNTTATEGAADAEG